MTAAIVDAPVHVSEEQHARAVLARLLAAHDLPALAATPVWRTESEAMIGLGYDPHLLLGRCASRADAHRWAAVLGVEASEHKRITELDGGRWSVTWSVHVPVEAWLPGVRLNVFWSQDRMCEPEETYAATQLLLFAVEDWRRTRGARPTPPPPGRSSVGYWVARRYDELVAARDGAS